ncbi:MAG TPA: HdeD family acid-resistance protein [Planctomycetaceae bacterium]|nr:HdeD family acid-resistance protein [Planctomycetaceae bacterium]
MSSVPEKQTPSAADSSLSGIVAEACNHELASFKRQWWWMFSLGVVLMILGLCAVTVPIVTSVAVVLFLGAFLFVGGVIQVVSAFWTGRWSGFLLELLIGIFYIVVGLLILDTPVASTLALTLLIAAFLIVSGLFRVISAIVSKLPGWGWHVLSGVITLVLGILLTKVLRGCDPGSALWVIGLFVGIEMLFNGLIWLMLGLEIRRIPVAASEKR